MWIFFLYHYQKCTFIHIICHYLIFSHLVQNLSEFVFTFRCKTDGNCFYSPACRSQHLGERLLSYWRTPFWAHGTNCRHFSLCHNSSPKNIVVGFLLLWSSAFVWLISTEAIHCMFHSFWVWQVRCYYFMRNSPTELRSIEKWLKMIPKNDFWIKEVLSEEKGSDFLRNNDQ